MENTVLQNYTYNPSRCLFLISVRHAMHQKQGKGHECCTAPTHGPASGASGKSNSGNLECMSYQNINYSTATKPKRERHCFASFPYLCIPFPDCIPYSQTKKGIPAWVRAPWPRVNSRRTASLVCDVTFVVGRRDKQPSCISCFDTCKCGLFKSSGAAQLMTVTMLQVTFSTRLYIKHCTPRLMKFKDNNV